MKLADEILLKLMQFVQNGRDILIPNYYFGMYEMDLFRLTNSGYVYEYEVKISRSDFKNDFKKGYSFFNGEKGNKHSDIFYRKYDVNKFYFVVPDGMIGKEEIPKGYGLIYYQNKYPQLRIVTPAKLLKPAFHIDYKNLAFKLSTREMFMRQKMRRFKADIDGTHKHNDILIDDIENNDIVNELF